MKDLQKRASELFSVSDAIREKIPLGKFPHDINQIGTCMKCDTHISPNHKEWCPIPDPIDITDLGKALEALRGLSLRPHFGMVIQKVYYKDHTEQVPMDYIRRWLLYEATAEQIWEICCLAKEKE